MMNYGTRYLSRDQWTTPAGIEEADEDCQASSPGILEPSGQGQGDLP